MSRSRQRKRNRNIQSQKGYWSLVEEAFGIKPRAVNGQFNLTTGYYKSELINILKGRFEIECPKFWDKDFMLNLLILDGRFFISDSSIGVAPFNGSPFGLNVFLRSSGVTIVNEILGNWERWITGVKMDKTNAVCVFLYDNLYYRSFRETIDMYAEKLASVDCSIDVNIMNSRVAYIFNAENTQQAEEAKLIYQKVTAGEPAVYTKVKNALSPEDGGLDVSAFPAKDMFIADKLFDLKRSIMSEFLTKIGINSTAFEKKERMLVDEVNGNNEETTATIAYINRNLKDCSERVREAFNIPFSIKMKVSDTNAEIKQTNFNQKNNV